MCRIAAYIGPPITLKQFMLQPSHSLYRQSWDARELTETRISADGFGVVWQKNEQLYNYRNTCPVWQDSNLPALAENLNSGLWLGNVRSATPGLGISTENTQPFAHADLAFTHNGRIQNFSQQARSLIRNQLSADIEADIVGNTDSEYLFALFRQVVQQTGALNRQCAEIFIQCVDDLLHDLEALLTCVISDGSQLLAIRHAIGGLQCPSLYYSDSHPDFKDGMIVASEAFDTQAQWHELPPHHLMFLKPNQTPQPVSIA